MLLGVRNAAVEVRQEAVLPVAHLHRAVTHVGAGVRVPLRLRRAGGVGGRRQQLGVVGHDEAGGAARHCAVAVPDGVEAGDVAVVGDAAVVLAGREGGGGGGAEQVVGVSTMVDGR